MKKLVMMISWLFLLISSLAQNLVPTDANSSVKFKIKNLGVNVSGSFTGLQGNINFDPSNPSASNFDVTVEAESINTGIDMRDNHLRKEEYFDIKNHPRLHFVSTKVTPGKSGSYNLVGNLTIKGVSKEVSFPFTAKPDNGGYIFTGEFRINRRDFKVGGNSITLSDNLTIILNVFARKN